MKTCTQCKCRKSLAEFNKTWRTKDGLCGICKECTRKRSAAHYQKNKEKRRNQVKAWLTLNPGKAAAYCKKWREANPEKNAESLHAWYIRNRVLSLAEDKARRDRNLQKFLERERASYQRNRKTACLKNARWRRANPDKIAAYAAERWAAKADRTPPWLTEEHLKEMAEFYARAAEATELLGQKCHVDHIVPLRGKTVSGLHVPWNLQVLPGVENLKKNNQMWPDMP